MKKKIKAWLPCVLGLFVVMLVALGIRLYNLTILPIFADEAIYIRWSQVMAAEPTLRFLPLSDGKQPMFMWVLMFIVNHISDPLVAGRLVSLLSGVGSVVAIFMLSQILFNNKKVSLASALLWAISPFSVFFDRMALVDAMLALFTVMTYLFAALMAKGKRIDAAIMAGVFLGLTSLTKSPALFVALMIPGFWILSFPWKKQAIVINLLQALGLMGIVYAFAFGLYNIQRLGPNFHMLTSRTQDYVFPISHLWKNPLDPFIPHFDRAFEWIWIMGPGTILFLAGLSLFVNIKSKWRETILLIFLFLFPLGIQAMYAKVFTARYILFTLPPLYILAGSLMQSAGKSIQKIALLFLGIFALQALLYNKVLLTNPEAAKLPRSERSGYLEEWTAGTGIKESADILKNIQKENPDKKIVVGTEGYFGTLPDGLQIYLQGTPNVVVIGTGLGFKEVPASLLESKQADNLTFFAANSSRLLFTDFEEQNLRIVASFAKATRPKEIYEYIKHGANDTFYLFELTGND